MTDFIVPKDLDQALEIINECVVRIEGDKEKTLKGVAKAGRRVRANLQTIVKTSKAARKIVTELKQ